MNSVPQVPEERDEAPLARRVVIVEDDPSNAKMLALTLQLETSYEVRLFSRGADLLAHIDEIKSNPPILFIFDYMLLAMNGIDLYDRVCSFEECATVPAVLLTAASPFVLAEAIAGRPITVIEKPFDIDALLEIIQQRATPLATADGIPYQELL